MAEHFELAQGDRAAHIALALNSLKDGYIIIAPLESSYVFLVDAFSHDGVRAMHALRGDPLFVAAQVLVASYSTAEGIIRDIGTEAKDLMKKFWPGNLSMNMRPQVGLNWDLGDGGELDQVSVRIPTMGFVYELLQESGPLAVASAAFAGRPAISDPALISVLDADVAAIFSAGVLAAGALSTVIEYNESNFAILRVGAISTDEITAIAPSISRY